jgi:glycine cleavage system aminomethyltransferase T
MPALRTSIWILEYPQWAAGSHSQTVSIGGESVGELSSAGWGWAACRCVALGYLRGPAAAAPHAGTPVTVDLWGEAVVATAS